MDVTATDRLGLINAIAAREGTAREIAKRYGHTVPELQQFVTENLPEIERVRQDLDALHTEDASDVVTPTELSQLWIANKFDRLLRLQTIAEGTYEQITDNNLFEDAVLLREFRSYLMLAANELGQLLHRGSGDSGSGDSLSVDFQGVDIESLR